MLPWESRQKKALVVCLAQLLPLGFPLAVTGTGCWHAFLPLDDEIREHPASSKGAPPYLQVVAGLHPAWANRPGNPVWRTGRSGNLFSPAGIPNIFNIPDA